LCTNQNKLLKKRMHTGLISVHVFIWMLPLQDTLHEFRQNLI
jgi:hypothetical protein